VYALVPVGRKWNVTPRLLLDLAPVVLFDWFASLRTISGNLKQRKTFG
jgi:hypothetical protein